MDTSDEKIVFDERGVCDHCHTFHSVIKPNWNTGVEGRKKLMDSVDRIKEEGRGKDFDCIIGMSGGIDSSYLTYKMKVEFDLRPLVFHVDAGWNSKEAVNNIERIVDQLSLDLYTEVIDWKEMKDLQLSFFKSGVPHIDTPQDHCFFAMMYKFAERYKVRHILTGSNFSTECIRNPIEWMYYQSDSVQLLDIQKKFGTRRLHRFPLTKILHHKVVLPYFKRIKVLTPLNSIPYEKASAVEELIRLFDWKPYDQKHFESRFTRFYEGYWLPERFGFDTRRVQFSSLILTDQMSRSDALEKLAEPSISDLEIERELEYVAKKLSVTKSDLLEYFNLPKRTYRDYRSQSKIYDIGARIMKLAKLEIGGKR